MTVIDTLVPSTYNKEGENTETDDNDQYSYYDSWYLSAAEWRVADNGLVFVRFYH